jgi:hypothetical protein
MKEFEERIYECFNMPLIYYFRTDGANKKIKDIETLVGQCPALIESTLLATVESGGLTMKDMFERFSSVDNFCGNVISH